MYMGVKLNLNRVYITYWTWRYSMSITEEHNLIKHD